MDQSDINMSDTTFEEDDERNFSSIASSQHLNDINRTSTYTSTISLKIKEHENPSTSAAAVVAAARAASKQSSLLDSDSCCSSVAVSTIQRPQPQRKQNILKKSSMYFSEKISKKKSTLFSKPSATTTTTTTATRDRLNQKRRSSPGIIIKPQESANVKFTPWWRRLNSYFIPRDEAHWDCFFFQSEERCVVARGGRARERRERENAQSQLYSQIIFCFFFSSSSSFISLSEKLNKRWLLLLTNTHLRTILSFLLWVKVSSWTRLLMYKNLSTPSIKWITFKSLNWAETPLVWRLARLWVKHSRQRPI